MSLASVSGRSPRTEAGRIIHRSGQRRIGPFHRHGHARGCRPREGNLLTQSRLGGGGCSCSCGGSGAMTYQYNADNQQTQMTDGAGNTTTYSYDGAGNQTQVTNALGTTTYAYNPQGLLLSTTDPLNGATSYSYNLAGWQTSETDPDTNVTQYGYNAAGQLISQTNPLNYQQTFSYNQAGQLTGQTDYNGQQTQYSYNEAGWKTGETWLNSQDQPIYQATYTYDNAGRLTSEQDANSMYNYSYNSSGQLTQTQVTYPAVSSSPLVTLSYGYDAFDNRTSLSDSLGGSLTYSYNGEHQLTGETFALNGVTGPQLSMGYDTQERLSSITRTAGTGDTIASNYSYDNASRLTNIVYTDTTKSTTLANYTYSYNTAGQVSSYQDNSGNSLTYGYDNNGQLTSASGTLNGSSYSGSWSYDANGNRTMTGYQTGTGNELLNDGTYTYTYDKNGNTLTKTNTATGDVWTYSWDYHNQMTEAVEKTKGGTLENDEKYTYDVEGRLIGVNVNGTQQRWTVFDGANPYLDFSGDGTTVTERYVTNPEAYGTLYARVSGSGTAAWYVTDLLGSVRQIVDPSGNVLDAIVYDPWGNIVSESNASNGDRFKYAGGVYDSIQQTYLFTERWLNPQDARWESPDPTGSDAGDSNLYRYVENSPVIFRDATGLGFQAIVATPGQPSLEQRLAQESPAPGYGNWMLQNPKQFAVKGPTTIIKIVKKGVLFFKWQKAVRYDYVQFWIVYPRTSGFQASPGQQKRVSKVTLQLTTTAESKFDLQGGNNPLSIGLSRKVGVTKAQDQTYPLVAVGGQDSYERSYIAAQVVGVVKVDKGGKLTGLHLYYTGVVTTATFKSTKNNC